MVRGMIYRRSSVETRQPVSPETGTFVVQIELGRQEQTLCGRVEHLASGAEARFGCTEDLLAFIRDYARAIRKGEDRQ